jgi:hypothetical protein
MIIITCGHTSPGAANNKKTGNTMQLTSHQPAHRDSGFALILIMCFLAVTLTVFASMMYWVSSNAKITLRNNAFTGAEAAAESANEVQLATMLRDYSFGGALNSVGSYTNLPPDQTGWPIGYLFYNPNLVIDTTKSTNLVVLGSQFSGLSGFVTYVTNTITAIATNAPVAVAATVQQTLQFASIPLNQYAIFYNMDLEICPGAGMTINGAVHSNNNIWTTGDGSGGNLLIYTTNVNASGSVYLRRSTNDPQSYTTGYVVFNDTDNNPLNNADSLTMPIGTNNSPAAVAALIQLPPSSLTVPSAAAYSPTGQVYFYNEADLIITNNAGGTNLTVLYNNPNVTPNLTSVLPDMMVITNYKVGIATYYVTNFVYSYVTNASFYDYRESDTVQAIQLDIAKFNAWLNTNASYLGTNRGGYQYNQLNTTGSSSKGHSIYGIYVYNSVPMSASTLPAVRLVNGSQLPPSGLTVATGQPMYVMGNYNVTNNGAVSFGLGTTTTGGALPAGLIADAITILSSKWSDSYSLANETDNTDGSGPNNRPAANTTINAAAMEGIEPSFTDSSGGQHYSGGVENFLRLLENWNPSGSTPAQYTLTYNGSIVVLFPSQYATNLWIGPGTYYNPPNRSWGFDVNFSKGQASLPPMEPQAKYVIRSSWSGW